MMEIASVAVKQIRIDGEFCTHYLLVLKDETGKVRRQAVRVHRGDYPSAFKPEDTAIQLLVAWAKDQGMASPDQAIRAAFKKEVSCGH